ncbi:MAG: hypothetical protein ABI861_13280 [Panacibacter sp.]
MKFLLLMSLLLIFAACNQTTSNSNLIQMPIKDTAMSDYSPTFEKANPIAKTIMKDSFYFDVVEEASPFGSDDGADTYASFKDWRSSHRNGNPKTFLSNQIEEWGYPKFDIYETKLEILKPYLEQDELNIQFMTGIDEAISSIAFGQLYLEGAIDPEFKELTKISLTRELIPEILDLWGDYKTRRQRILQKMMEDLELVK